MIVLGKDGVQVLLQRLAESRPENIRLPCHVQLIHLSAQLVHAGQVGLHRRSDLHVVSPP